MGFLEFVVFVVGFCFVSFCFNLPSVLQKEIIHTHGLSSLTEPI